MILTPGIPALDRAIRTNAVHLAKEHARDHAKAVLERTKIPQPTWNELQLADIEMHIACFEIALRDTNRPVTRDLLTRLLAKRLRVSEGPTSPGWWKTKEAWVLHHPSRSNNVHFVDQLPPPPKTAWEERYPLKYVVTPSIMAIDDPRHALIIALTAVFKAAE